MDLQHGLRQVEAVEGSAFDDVLLGLDGDQRLVGGGGNDRLQGRAGSDILVGDGGVKDLFGQSGADTFVSVAGTNLIHDYEFATSNGALVGMDSIGIGAGSRASLSTSVFPGFSLLLRNAEQTAIVNLDTTDQGEAIERFQALDIFVHADPGDFLLRGGGAGCDLPPRAPARAATTSSRTRCGGVAARSDGWRCSPSRSTC